MPKTVVPRSSLPMLPKAPKSGESLTSQALYWQERGERHRLSFQDVVGVSLAETEGNHNHNFPCLILHAYPKGEETSIDRPTPRVLKEYCLTCLNLEVRSQWQIAIENALVGQPMDAKTEPRRLQVIINPVSGKKQAVQIFEQVRPLLDRSYLRYTVLKTSRANETQELARNLDLANIDGLVLVGGDGTGTSRERLRGKGYFWRN